MDKIETFCGNENKYIEAQYFWRFFKIETKCLVTPFDLPYVVRW